MKRDTTKHYGADIDIESVLLDGCLLDEYCRYQDAKNRRLYLSQEISQTSVGEIANHLLQYNRDDMGKPVEERAPVIIYITSVGGSEDDGFELIDLIENSKTPVYTVNLGYQYSMGFLIGLAGHKRYATKSSKFMHHDGWGSEWNTVSKMQDRLEFVKRTEERIKQYVLSKSNITSAEYDEKYRTEWYMFADEAKDKGFCDYIIGEDCDLDEVL